MKKGRNMRAGMLMVILAALVVVGGCGQPTKPGPEEARVVPTFDFVPPSKTPVDTASVVFCLVRPQFPEAWKDYLAYYPFDKFSKNMASDFEEILSARGYRMRGPFQTYDEMTFPDKNESDLILIPKIEIDDRDVGSTKASKDIFGTVSYRWKGTVNLGGRIVIAVNETLTNERMWSKSIELPTRSFSYESPKYGNPIQHPQLSDTKFNNLLADHLQEYYTLIMDKLWQYLDPQEMAMVKQQAQALKEKKRF